MSNSCKVPEVKPIVIKRFGVSGLVPTIPTTTDCNLWSKTDLKDGELAINIRDKKLYIRADEQILEITNQVSGGGSGTVTSVGLSMPSAFTVTSSPVTSSGTIVVTGAGTTSQYIRGDGSLDTFPTIPTVTPSALTKVDDTNVTLTLGGTPSTALLESTSITVGWSGELAVSRGGTGAGTFTANSVLLGNGTSAFQEVAPGSSGNVLTSNGTTWVSQAPSGGISGLTTNRFVYATGATTIATDNNAYFDGTQIAFGTSSPIANVRTTIFGTGTTSSTWALQIHNSTGTSNSFTVRDDGRVDISAGDLHIGDNTSNGRIWFGNASSPTGANNGYINIQSTSSAAGSIINIPGTDSNNETTRLDIRHRDRADGFRFYPGITGGGGLYQGKGVIGKGTYGSGTFGIDFAMFGTPNALTQGQSEAYRFFSSSVLNTVVVSTLRFQIGNGANIVPNFFVNSQLGITDNSSITVGTNSLLDLQSTTKGLQVSRMTTAERDAVSWVAGDAGMIIYNTTTNKHQGWNGSTWNDCY
jgi:hypothetical protein